MQRSLFPDAFEVEEDALAALAELDLAGAAHGLARARALNPTLPNLVVFEEVVAYLGGHLRGPGG
ncbi:MAG: hypothetical protein HZA54_01245, partial [Planctomycetes bacterium]|nr:hypothetical protein [Planctomycetota bacterium]